MIKWVLTFVSGVQESVLVDFICQNKVKILHKVKIVFIKNFLTKTNKFIFMASRKGKPYCFYLAISALFDTSSSCGC